MDSCLLVSAMFVCSCVLWFFVFFLSSAARSSWFLLSPLSLQALNPRVDCCLWDSLGNPSSRSNCIQKPPPSPQQQQQIQILITIIVIIIIRIIIIIILIVIVVIKTLINT